MTIKDFHEKWDREYLMVSNGDDTITGCNLYSLNPKMLDDLEKVNKYCIDNKI